MEGFKFELIGKKGTDEFDASFNGSVVELINGFVAIIDNDETMKAAILAAVDISENGISDES